MNDGLDFALLREYAVFRALEELDSRLASMGVSPFELKVVGGFALLLEQVRFNGYTDIDYVGRPLPDNVKQVVDEIGLEFGLGRGWVNNDLLLAGSDLEGLEAITGHLEFRHRWDGKVISVHSLDLEHLLRMKIIAIDTSYAGLEFGGDFSRVKDFPDVKLLMEHLHMELEDLVEETYDYVVCPEIFFLVRYYLRTGDLRKLLYEEGRKRVISEKGKQ